MSKFQQAIRSAYLTLNEQDQGLEDLPDLPDEFQEGEEDPNAEAPVPEEPPVPEEDPNAEENAKPLADTERIQLINIAAKAALADTDRIPHSIKLKLDGDVSSDNIDEIRDILSSLIDMQTV